MVHERVDIINCWTREPNIHQRFRVSEHNSRAVLEQLPVLLEAGNLFYPTASKFQFKEDKRLDFMV